MIRYITFGLLTCTLISAHEINEQSDSTGQLLTLHTVRSDDVPNTSCGLMALLTSAWDSFKIAADNYGKHTVTKYGATVAVPKK